MAEPTGQAEQTDRPYSRIGARLLELRAARLITMQQLAKDLRCHRSMISQVERGACLPTMERLTRWAAVLGAQDELQTLLALQQEDARAARQAGTRVKARVMTSRIQAPRS